MAFTKSCSASPDYTTWPSPVGGRRSQLLPVSVRRRFGGQYWEAELPGHPGRHRRSRSSKSSRKNRRSTRFSRTWGPFTDAPDLKVSLGSLSWRALPIACRSGPPRSEWGFLVRRGEMHCERAMPGTGRRHHKVVRRRQRWPGGGAESVVDAQDITDDSPDVEGEVAVLAAPSCAANRNPPTSASP